LLDIACGTYLLTVTDANECVVTQTVTLSCVPQIQITFEVEPNPCLDPEAGVGTITILTTTGGHGDPYFYDWIGPEGFVASGATLTGLISGSYTVTVTDPFGCTRDFNITVGTNDAFDVTAVVENASCAGSCNGSINQTIVPPGAYNFTWNGPNGPLAATEDQVGLCAGLYIVQVEISGCIGEFQYLISEPAPIVIELVSSLTPPCFGQNTGSIDIAISGGTGALTVSWAAVPESFFPGSSNEDLAGLFDGCYTVTVTDENGCTETATFCLDAPQVMIISVEVTEFNGGFNISCAGAQDGQISVTVSGGTPDCTLFAPFCYEYDWSNCGDVSPNDPNSNLLTALSGGVYCVDVFDSNGCLATTTITLTEPEPIQDNANVQNVSCIGLTDGSITPNLNGGSGTYIDFDWTQGDIGTNAPDATTLTNLVPGCYTLVVTDNNQCTQEFTWCVEEPELLVLSIDELIFPSCEVTTGSAFFSASGGTPNFTFETTGPGGPFFGDAISGLEAGVYIVTVTDAGGCTDSDTFEIQLIEDISVTINASIQDPGQIFTLQCTGDLNGTLEAIVQGGAPDYTFIWTDESLNEIGSASILSGLGAGTYCVEVIDQNGCSASACFTITEPEFPLIITSEILTYGDYNISCFGECDGSIDLTVSGGVGPYTYLWELGGGTLNFDEDQFALCAGATEVLVTDANGCSQLIQFILTSPTPIVIESILSQFDGGFNVSCNGECDGSISISALGGDGVLTIEWTNPVLPAGTEQTDLCAGNYTVVVTDERGCQETALISIAEPEILEVSINSNFNCTTGIIDLCASATGGSSNYSFSWSDGSQTQCISPTEAGEYCVTVTDGNGCVATICITISTPEILSASTVVTPTSCGQPNGAINVTINSGTGPFTFDWTGAGTVDGQEDQTGLASGSYTVTITDGFGCVVELTVQVTQGDDVLVEVASENLRCFRDSSGAIEVIITNGLDPISYSWTQDGDSFAGEDILTDLPVGTYVLTWSDANGCSGTETVIITQPNPISINAEISLYANGFNISTNGGADGAISTEVSGGTGQYIYDWSFDPLDSTPGGNNLSAGTYELTVTDANGCVTDTTIILTEPFELALPTGLSPNGDGDNDTYVILGIEGFEKNEFRVFNRWGSLVYEKNNYNNEWGGESKNGEMLADGTYFVVFVAGGFEFNTYVDLRR